MMTQFIKAIEIWIPGDQPSELQLVQSYSESAEFKDVSQSMRFAYGDGLPGRTWAEGEPVVLSDISEPYFKRVELAEAANIRCAVSIPIFGGEFLQAVVVLFCGNESGQVGAMELWQNPDGSNTELRLVDGFYGDLERFEWVSRKLTIMRDRGLPGLAWAENCPVVMTELHKSTAFLRAANAAESGISNGIAIPFTYGHDHVRVLTFLSAEDSPIAQGFEIWAPDKDGGLLTFYSGYQVGEESLAARYGDTGFEKGEGLLGRCWLSGRPALIGDGANKDSVQLVLPVIHTGKLNWIVRLIF